MKIINKIKDLEISVEGKVSDGYNVTLSKKKLHAVDAVSGMGMTRCFYMSSGRSGRSWHHEFNVEYSKRVSIGTDKDTATVFVPDLPFSGFMGPDLIGYIAAATAKINVRMGVDIALMHFAHSPKVASISSDNPKLSVSDKDGRCEAELTDSNGRLSIACAASGTGFQAIRLELARTPYSGDYSFAGAMMLTQVLANFGPGSLNLEWPPVTRELEEDFLIAFHPAPLIDMGSGSFKNTILTILEEVGKDSSASKDNSSKSMPDFVVLGDGPLIRYQLALIMDKRFSTDGKSTAYLDLK